MSGGQRNLGDVQGEIDEEIAFHLGEAARERVAAGMAEDAARASAVADFGDVRRVRAACQKQRLWRDHMMQRFHLALTLFFALCTGFFVFERVRGHYDAQRRLEFKAAWSQLPANRGFLASENALVPEEEPTRKDLSRYAVGDVLRILDTVEPARFTRMEDIGEDGKINLPNVGWIHVEGFNREELKAKLDGLFEAYYVDPPQFEIVLLDAAPHRVPPVESVVISLGETIRFTDPLHPDEWSGEGLVEPDGTCLFPQVGRLSVVSLERSELEALLRARLHQFYIEGSEATVKILKGKQ